MPVAAGVADDEASAVFGVALAAGYRDWRLIGVAHRAGGLNDIRAVLGNDVAVRAFQDGTRPFPDGAVIARLAWQYVPSAENNAIFGQAQFEGGRPNRDEALLNTCFPCHNGAPRAADLVFTRYAP